jgi:uncharacterized protein (DUF302 family)
MSVPVRASSIPTRTPRRPAPLRAAGVVLAVAMAASACGNLGNGDVAAPPAAPPGQAAGTIVVPAGTDVAAAVQRIRDAITAGNGTVVTVVDHTANARAAGVEIPPTSEVIGGPPAAGLPLLRVDQRAGANLPEHYLVRQATDGSVTVTANSADYVSAVSGILPDDARTALQDSTAAVLDAVAPGGGAVLPAPLVGVTPSEFLLTVFGSTDVTATAQRLRTAADRAPTRSVAVVDLATPPADGGPPIRPTSLVFVSNPAAEAPLLAAAPSFGIDLPLRFVIWRDEQNRTQIGYPDVRRLALRHGVSPDDPNVARLVADADRLARTAAGLLQ